MKDYVVTYFMYEVVGDGEFIPWDFHEVNVKATSEEDAKEKANTLVNTDEKYKFLRNHMISNVELYDEYIQREERYI